MSIRTPSEVAIDRFHGFCRIPPTLDGDTRLDKLIYVKILYSVLEFP